MDKQTKTELKVGFFVSVGLGLILLAVAILGGENFLSRKNKYESHFSSVDGLISGSKVTLGGVSIGVVDSILFDYEKRAIRVLYSVSPDTQQWIRQDSTVEISTQGVLGDKYISINPGSPHAPTLPSGSIIPRRDGKDLSQFLSRGDNLMTTLSSIAVSLDRILKNFDSESRSETFFKGLASSAKNLSQATEKMNKELDQLQLKKAVGQLNQIFEKINNGNGTVGALINDPGLYDQAKALLGGANRNRIIRNLVRQTIKKSEEETAPSGNSVAPKK